MAKIEIILPAMGEGIIEATLTKWLVKEGQQVDEDQSIVEIATDKVDSEIPAPKSGIIQKILVVEGSVPKIGDTIAILQTETIENEENDAPVIEKESKIEKVTDKIIPEISNSVKNIEDSTIVSHSITEGKFLSPLVKSIVQKENISSDELGLIRGSSNTGRITKNDLLNYLSNRKSSGLESVPKSTSVKSIEPVLQTKTVVSKEQLYSSGEHEIVQMDRMRKLIADHMVYSKQVSPHVTSFVEADVTNMVIWRNKIKDAFQA